MTNSAAKYIIAKEGAIIFNPCYTHREVAAGKGTGFVRFLATRDGEVSARCYGKSESLGIESRPEEDAEAITRSIL